MIRLLILFVALSTGVYAQLDEINLTRSYDLYSMAWSGASNSGVAFSIAIPSNVSTTRTVYPLVVSLYSPAASTLTVLIKDATDPSVISQSPIGVNTNTLPQFSFYPESNLTGGYTTFVHPLSAGPNKITLLGNMLQKGQSTGRNITLIMAPAAGTAYFNAMVAQEK